MNPTPLWSPNLAWVRQLTRRSLRAGYPLPAVTDAVLRAVCRPSVPWMHDDYMSVQNTVLDEANRWQWRQTA